MSINNVAFEYRVFCGGRVYPRHVLNNSSKLIMVFLAAAPVLFKKELESQEAIEGDEATLSCETSSPDCKVTWLKDSTVLTHGEKYSMEQRATTHILLIHKLNVKDSGEYTCDTGDKRSTASLTVKGNRVQLHLIYYVSSCFHPS